MAVPGDYQLDGRPVLLRRGGPVDVTRGPEGDDAFTGEVWREVQPLLAFCKNASRSFSEMPPGWVATGHPLSAVRRARADPALPLHRMRPDRRS